MSSHAILWIDHHEARLLGLPPNDADASKEKVFHLRSHTPNRHTASGKHADHRRYYDEVTKAIDGVSQLLIVGPSTAKLELKSHLDANAPSVAAKVIGVETVDHPSDAQLVAHAEVLRALRADALSRLEAQPIIQRTLGLAAARSTACALARGAAPSQSRTRR